MLHYLMSVSLRHRLLVGLTVMVIVGLGTWAASTIPIDAFPDVTNIQVEVVATAPGLSPLEIETTVTYPLEMAMRGLPGLVLMRSVTKSGLSVLTLVFRDDIDIYFAREQVHQRIEEVRRRLPEDVDVDMGPIATAMGEIYQYTLEPRSKGPAGDEVQALTRLRTLQDWIVSPLLKSLPGVIEVNSFGGYIEQFEILVAPERLRQYALSVEAISQAVQQNNVNVGGNIVERHEEQYVIRGVGLIRSEADLKAIVLRAVGGTPVTIGDVAEVRLSHAIRQGASLKNGEREVVGGIVMMLRGENSREVLRRVEEKVEEINTSGVLPDDLQIVPFYRRSIVVDESIRTVTSALAAGAGLVLLVLMVLLRSLRGALIVIVALPLSALLTFIVMRVAGVNANLMSLGGLAISIGMIIDATIIQVENVQRHLSRGPTGATKLDTVLAAAMEVRKPSIFGELIIALTFVPILTLQGMEGKMFAPLALTVAIALLSSLLLSIFVIPTLCLVTLRGARRESAVIRAARAVYRPLLLWALRHRILVLVFAVSMVVGAAVLLPRLGTEFLPIMDEGAFDMDIQMLPGVSLDEALRTTRLVQQRLMRFPELETVVSRTGQTGIALEARGVDKTGFVGSLRPRNEWTTARTREELIEKMRAAIEDVPGIATTFSQPIQCRIDELVAGTRAQVIIKVFGNDMYVLRQKAQEMASVLQGVRGVTDLVVERVAGQPYLTITVDRSRLARYGLNASDLLTYIETAVGGKPVSHVYFENRVVDVVLRLPDSVRQSVEALSNLLIEGTDFRLPLGQVADVAFSEGPVQISRENGQRLIGIELNVAGRDIGSLVAEARQRIRQRVTLPPGYVVTVGGQFENQQQAMRRLTLIAPAVAALIFILLLVTLGSVRLALLVLANLPFAMVGGVLALWISGLYLSVPASVGFIVLFGVAVLNGLVLMSSIVQLQAQGLPRDAAIASGCETRLRPVLMTASIAVFSLIPLLFATGPGAEVQRPLAVVVVGGLITSTFLTLLVLPALYAWATGSRVEGPGAEARNRPDPA